MENSWWITPSLKFVPASVNNMMDNRVFNVNGEGEVMLTATLKLLFTQCNAEYTKAHGWAFTPKHGFIVYQYPGVGNRFPTPLTAEQLAPIVWAWLNGDEAKTVECDGWDADCDHDGDNGPGWRVFCEDWGHVNGDYNAVCAIKPAYMWYGK